ncbi:MAG: serine/threonine protein kinase [Marinicella sp.]
MKQDVSFKLINHWFNQLVDEDQESQLIQLSKLEESEKLSIDELKLLTQMLIADSGEELPKSLSEVAEVWSENEAHTNLKESPIIGPYKLLQLIGSGGMGHVYLAERNDGSYEQLVAIKVAQFHYSRSLIKRFENERQILAQLTHPNIAQLLDGGTAKNDQPYLVMEFIKGLSIDAYCVAHNLGLRERLELVIQTCHAVSFAHQNLVLHRDLKPANIMVNEVGQVKLLDFGIAKLLAEEDDRQQTMTQIMTRNYASPEQIKGQQVTTQSDLFSLAIITYEIVSGYHPFERSSELERDQKVVSGQIKSITNRQDSQAALFPELSSIGAEKLNGDLENILIKAMSPEVDHRYGSIDSFAEDLENFINHRPVKARKLSFFYSLRKLIQRNTAVSAVVLLLSLGLIFTTLFSIKKANDAEVQRLMAIKESNQSHQISDFLIGVFASAQPLSEKRELTARDLLTQGFEDIKSQLHDAPEQRFELMAVMFDSLESLSYFDTIFHYIDEVHPNCIKVLSPQNRHCQSLLITAGESAVSVQEDQQALEYLQLAERNARIEPIDQSLLAKILRIQFNAYINLKMFEQAVASTNEALHYYQNIEFDALELLNIYSDLAVLATHQGDFVQAQQFYDSMQNLITNSGQISLDVQMRFHGNYSFFFIKQKKFPQAIEQRKLAVSLVAGAYDRPSFSLVWEQESLAKTYFFAGDIASGIKTAEQALVYYSALESEAGKLEYDLKLFKAEMWLLSGKTEQAIQMIEGLEKNEWNQRCVFELVEAMLAVQQNLALMESQVKEFEDCISTSTYPTKYANELLILLNAELNLLNNDISGAKLLINQLSDYWLENPMESLPLKSRFKILENKILK